MKIEVKYCGGCNPFIDRVNILNQVVALLGGKVDITFVSAAGSDVLLVIDGCCVGCRGNEFRSKNDKTVLVAGDSVQGEHVDEEHIPTVIVKHLKLLKLIQ